MSLAYIVPIKAITMFSQSQSNPISKLIVGLAYYGGTGGYCLNLILKALPWIKLVIVLGVKPYTVVVSTRMFVQLLNWL